MCGIRNFGTYINISTKSTQSCASVRLSTFLCHRVKQKMRNFVQSFVRDYEKHCIPFNQFTQTRKEQKKCNTRAEQSRTEQNRASLTTSPHCNATLNKCAVSCSLINTINFHLLLPHFHAPFAVSFLHIVFLFQSFHLLRFKK